MTKRSSIQIEEEDGVVTVTLKLPIVGQMTRVAAQNLIQTLIAKVAPSLEDT